MSATISEIQIPDIYNILDVVKKHEDTMQVPGSKIIVINICITYAYVWRGNWNTAWLRKRDHKTSVKQVEVREEASLTAGAVLERVKYMDCNFWNLKL